MRSHPLIASSLSVLFASLSLAFLPGGSIFAAPLTGVVQLGGTTTSEPLRGVRVNLWEATPSAPTHLGQARTDKNGTFSIESPVQTTSSVLFVTADVGLAMQFVAVLGTELPPFVTINELTTVAACYSNAQFFRSGRISGDPFRLRIAAGMNDNIAAIATGESSPVLLLSPNADETIALRSTRSLANLLQAMVRYPLLRLIFLQLTRPPGGPFPANTAIGLANLARDPARHVQLLYLASRLEDAYAPPLRRPPDAWTIAIKFNKSGDDSVLFGGPGNVAFDSRGYAWLTNNVVQGTPLSATTIMVLKPNGDPADGGPGLPMSPINGGGILGSGWGICVDPLQTVWVGNFGWGGVNPTEPDVECPDDFAGPCPNGSVSAVSSAGVPLSNPNGYFAGSLRVQAIESDAEGNIWMASFGNDSVVYFPKGDPTQARVFPLYEGSRPFGLAIDADGAAWVTNSGGLAGLNPCSVAKFVINDEGEIEQQFLTFIGDTLKVIQIDSLGNAWFVSQGNDRIYVFAPDGTLINSNGFTGGGVDGPWGMAIDGDDNIWVSNFGQVALGNFNNGGLSKFAGANPATRPRGTRLGQALSPPTGFTLPSAGQQVLLPDGTPLNGPDALLPVFSPLMRQTSVQIDQAGNCWAINNYKPRFSSDVLLYNDGDHVSVDPGQANPGGDGIVIFVGLAPPPPRGLP